MTEMMKVTYGGNTFEVPASSDINEVKESLKGIYPEIANATAVRTDDGYKFEVQAGTKGSGEDLTVVYNDNRFVLPEGSSLNEAEIKDALKGIYPEIANATGVREGNTLTFSVQAGTKGA